MKKLLLPILFLMLVLPAMSQGLVSIIGTVKDNATGNPIPNHAVTISSDSTSGWFYYHTVFTNMDGYYFDNAPIPFGGQGVLFVRTGDCENNLTQFVLIINPANTNFTVDFSICNSNTLCAAGFTAQQEPPLTVFFHDASTGGGDIRHWLFGDGGASNQMNPHHTYGQPGPYVVTLTIGAPGTNCYSSMSMGIVVGDSVVTSGCHADFTAHHDNDSLLLYRFEDESTGDIVSWAWNFGDGTTSSAKNPYHYYAQAGNYMVCLSVQGADPTCFDMKCDTIQVGNNASCESAFAYYADSSSTYNVLHFIDQSGNNIASWNWNFGDPASGPENFSTEQNPTHIFSGNGHYDVCLTIYSADGTCHDTDCHTILVGIGPGCHADFNIHRELDSLFVYHFDDESTGNINSWIWNFGDGITATGQNQTHIYTQPGIYQVCLTILGADSCSDTKCETLEVQMSYPCESAFTYYADTLNTTNAIHFIDQSVSNVVSWSWDFGDPASGPNNFSTQQNPTHIYAEPGEYHVCLTIQGADSTCHDTDCHMIFAGSTSICHAHFSYITGPALGNHTVSFTDLSTGNPTSWLWSFGDGTSGNEQNPVHTYGGPGNYQVCLTIAGNNCTSTFCKNVVVHDSLNYHQVYGQVFAGNFPINMGIALIFTLDTNAIYQPFIDVSPIDSNGVYFFTMVPDGNYYIMAIPLNPSGYMPTYYGNTISWQQATLVTLGAPANPYNINLVVTDHLTPGPGSIVGQINVSGLKSAALDKINMMLMNDQGNPIGFTEVSITGAFSFPSLAYGSYTLHAEMPGVVSDYVNVTLAADQPQAVVGMTFTGNKILGMRDESSMVSGWSVYPNPLADKLTISIKMKQGTTAEIAIYDLAGKKVASSNVVLNTGANAIEMPANTLSAGIYMLQIYSRDGLNISTKLVKTR